MLEIDQHYYVDMPWIPTMIKEQPEEIANLYEIIPKLI